MIWLGKLKCCYQSLAKVLLAMKILPHGPSPHPHPSLQRACDFQSSLSVFLFYLVHVGDQEETSSFVTLQCYRINFSQAHSIRFNTSSVKEGQSSPLGWPSEKKCVLGKLMKWKVLYYAAKSLCHVATRTAGCDSVFMSDACVGKGC